MNVEKIKSMSVKKFSINLISWYCLMYISMMVMWDVYVSSIFKKFYIISLVLFGGISYIKLNYRIIKKSDKVKLLFGLYVVYVFINSIITYTRLDKFIGGCYIYLIYSMSFWFCLYSIKYINLNIILKCISIFSLLESSLACYEYAAKKLIFNSNYEFSGVKIGGSAIYRSRVFTESPLTLGLLLAIFAIINLYFYMNIKEKKYLVFYIINLIGILSTSSRGPLVSLVAGSFIMLKYFGYFKLTSMKNIVIKATIIFVVSSLILVVFNSEFSFNNDTLDYFLVRIKSIFDWNGESSNVTRKVHWVYFIDLWLKNFFFGIGIGSTGGKGLGIYSLGVTESGVLKRLVEIGLVGSIIYYSFVLIIIRKGIRKIQKKSYCKNYIILGISIVITILIDDITLQITDSPIIAFAFWVSLALIYHYSGIRKEYQYNNVAK